jgi:hypothetical protein
MSYRRYPSVDRALRQLDGHYPPAPAMQLPECLRPMAESFARLRAVGPATTPNWSENAVAVVGMSGLTAGELLRRWGAAGRSAADAYRLSSRPGVVGGSP